MSAEQRKWASDMSRSYARLFKVPIEEVHVEYRDDDDDAEIWAPGVGVVWTRGSKPYESTMRAAGAMPSRCDSEGEKR